jgi:hypothetical protein
LRIASTFPTPIDPATEQLSFLFHPRRQRWDEHFRLDGPEIVPLTPKGRVTEHLLQLNGAERVFERDILIRMKRYPCGNPIVAEL